MDSGESDDLTGDHNGAYYGKEKGFWRNFSKKIQTVLCKFEVQRAHCLCEFWHVFLTFSLFWAARRKKCHARNHPRLNRHAGGRRRWRPRRGRPILRDQRWRRLLWHPHSPAHLRRLRSPLQWPGNLPQNRLHTPWHGWPHNTPIYFTNPAVTPRKHRLRRGPVAAPPLWDRQ